MIRVKLSAPNFRSVIVSQFLTFRQVNVCQSNLLGNFCDHHKLSPESNEMSSYAKEICPSNFYYTVSNNSESTCSECQVEDLANCQPVYERFKDVAFTASSIHCAPNALLSCKSDLPSSSCLTSSGFSARSSSTGSIQFEKQAVFLNSIAISYNTTSFEFIIPIDLIGDTTFSSIEAIFSPLHAASNKCAEYTNVDKQALSPLLICKNHQLYSPADNFTHDDYLLVGENIQVCTALVPDFSLSIHDYIITAFSIAAATIYTVYYFVNLKKTVTGNFVVSSLLTVVGGLIFLCLIDQTGNKNSCRFIATFSHYFFLSSHTWTTSIGFWILKGIISFSIAQDRGWKTYLRYASFAWATPVVFVIFSYIFDGLEIRGLYPVFGDSLCFIATGWIRLLVFTGPIYLLILINVSFCAIATFKIIKEGNKITIQRKNELQRKVITVVKLQIVFGVHWILIIFSEIQGPHQQALWTIVKIFMTSQGVNVVIAQLVTLKNLRKVRFKFNSLVNPTNSTNLSPLPHRRSNLILLEKVVITNSKR
ncbi:hypothetical protein EB796_024467 [Bugula neritina]|uniref:G-protein coupled receptors family 2 profile 2 domain-containing protein n=1 Tax=Bugula neritina TaxID=10212 RepID=A0A7J7IUM8_BUGNE|nr:hypothetical protein EB796_024467 [Bugula neritina]